MRAVILAGGSGTRLYPLTQATNKHLLPVGRKPMILHSIDKLVAAQIREIMIITGPEWIGDFARLLGSGESQNCSITYKVQDRPGGIAQGLQIAQDFCHDGPFLLLLGDNLFEDSFEDYIRIYHQSKSENIDAFVLLKEVDTPERFGVASLQGKKIQRIVEKPKNPETRLAVTGFYIYPSDVFSIVDTIKPSDRGELEITDVNNRLIEQNRLGYALLKGWWSDAGTFESLDRVQVLLKG